MIREQTAARKTDKPPRNQGTRKKKAIRKYNRERCNLEKKSAAFWGVAIAEKASHVFLDSEGVGWGWGSKVGGGPNCSARRGIAKVASKKKKKKTKK